MLNAVLKNTENSQCRQTRHGLIAERKATFNSWSCKQTTEE